MTTGQVPGMDDQRSGPTAPCPCGRGDVAMETERERPLLERAIAGDPTAFAELYAQNVDDVYRYLLAWTGDEAGARELTEQVFRNALTWLPVIADGEGDVAAWLLSSARDAVVQHRSSGWVAAAGRSDEPAPDVLVAFTQLDDAQREVVVLRLLLGHSLAHTAHLAGYSTRVVGELQLAACASIWERLSGAPVEAPPPGPGPQDQRARWFERCLEGAYLDSGGDPRLQDVLAVADALRQAAPRQVPLPDDAFVQRLRQQLTGEMGGEVAALRRHLPRGNRLAGAFALVRYHVGRHPWAATVVAAAAIGLILGIQIATSTGTRSACGNGRCLTSTTDTTVAAQAGVGVPTVSSGPGLGATTLLSTTSAPPTTLSPTTRTPSTAPATAPPTTARALTTTTRKNPGGPPSSHGKPTTTERPTTTETPTTTAAAPTTTAGGSP